MAAWNAVIKRQPGSSAIIWHKAVVPMPKTVGDVLEAEEYGIAVKKGNDKLAAEIDKALAELKKNGEYDKIYKTWFGEVKK